MEPNLRKNRGKGSFDCYENMKPPQIALRCVSRCELDGDGYLSLDEILHTYHAPINEDHAWALCYQSIKFLDSLPLNIQIYKEEMGDTEYLKIHRDGHVSLNIIFNEGREICMESPSTLLTRSQVISKVALTIYKALDFGIREEEERSLSLELEKLLDMMASLDDKCTLDERHIIQYSDSKLCELQCIREKCVNHLRRSSTLQYVPTWQEVDSVYREVCQNIVCDAIQLSRFLDIAARASRELNIPNQNPSKSERTLRCVENFKGVAKLWIRVVRELRHGVKLKHREDSHIREPHEYKKTPYETLMDEIRSQKYRLRKVSQDRECKRRTTPDVHERIMEYIRSGPKLRKTSDRVLRPPPPKVKDPIEELMLSIRQTHHLRPVKRNLQ